MSRAHKLTYTSWYAMKMRCLNPTHVYYRNYGGRGITICDRWLSYANFVADMGERPSGTTIDRINNDGNYEPENCRWATRAEQRLNTRMPIRQSVPLEVNGVARTIKDISRETGLHVGTIRERLYRGWTPEKAVSEPPRKHQGMYAYMTRPRIRNKRAVVAQAMKRIQAKRAAMLVGVHAETAPKNGRKR